MKNIILFIIYVILSVSGLILFKLGSSNSKICILKNILNLQVDLNIIFGILCYGLSFILWLFIIDKFDISYIMPISVGVINVFVLLASNKFLKENITTNKIYGILFIVIGIFFISKN